METWPLRAAMPDVMVPKLALERFRFIEP